MASVNDRRHVFVLLAPAMLVVGLTTIYPLGFSFWTSFHDWRLIKSLLPGDFIGLENYIIAFTDDPVFWTVVRVTIRFVVIDVVATILAALGLALLLMRAGFARSVLRTIIILPFAVSPALIGISWRFMFNPEYGAIHHTISTFLPFMARTDWFASPGLATYALVSADLWHWAPYFAFMLMGGLASVPAETQEAARIDGASDVRVFWSITLPQMAPVITVTGGGPGLETSTLAFFAYNTGFRDYDMGYAAAIAYVLTLILFGLSFFYMRFILPRGK
jgi:multiple sugar transport system permease protein